MPELAAAINNTISDSYARSVTLPGWRATVQAGLLHASGNVNELVTNGAVAAQRYRVQSDLAWHETAQYRLPGYQWHWIVQANGELGYQAGTRFKESLYGHVRLVHMFWQGLGFEILAQVQSNPFQRLQFRSLGGGGLRYDLVRRARLTSWVGAALLGEWEQVETSARTSTARASFVVALTARSDDGRLNVLWSNFVQPRVDDWADIRLLHSLDGSVQVWGPLLAALTGTVAYDSRPPATVQRLDTRIETSLRLKFENAGR